MKRLEKATILLFFAGALAFLSGCEHEEDEGKIHPWLSDISSKAYYTSESGEKVYFLKSDVEDKQELNMASGDNLTNFLKFLKENYTFDHLILTFGSHGVGPVGSPESREICKSAEIVRAMCPDETDAPSYSDFLYSDETALAFKNAGFGDDNKIDMLIIDVCNGISIEDALEYSDYARTLLSSPDLQPGPGFPYSSFMKSFKVNTNLYELGLSFIDNFIDYAKNGNYTDNSKELGTLTFADLSKVNYAVDAIEKCASYMLQNKDNAILPACSPEIISSGWKNLNSWKRGIELNFEKSDYSNLTKIGGGKWLFAMYLAADNNLQNLIYNNMKDLSKGLASIQDKYARTKSGYADVKAVAIYDGLYNHSNQEYAKTCIYEIYPWEGNISSSSSSSSEEDNSSEINIYSSLDSSESCGNPELSWLQALTDSNYQLLSYEYSNHSDYINQKQYVTDSHYFFKEKKRNYYNMLYDSGLLFQNFYLLSRAVKDEEFEKLTKETLNALYDLVVDSWALDYGLNGHKREGLYPHYNALYNYFGVPISGESSLGGKSNNTYARNTMRFIRETHWKDVLKEAFPEDF